MWTSCYAERARESAKSLAIITWALRWASLDYRVTKKVLKLKDLLKASNGSYDGILGKLQSGVADMYLKVRTDRFMWFTLSLILE